LPEKLGATYNRVIKIKKFFQPPKYATFDVPCQRRCRWRIWQTMTSITTMAGIMFTCCIQYKSSKPPMNYTRVN